MKNEAAIHIEVLPPVMSGEQVRKVLHISKRRCAWLLNNGYIKCDISSKRSRKYKVMLTDLENFVQDFVANPEKYSAAASTFSSAKNTDRAEKTFRRYGFPVTLPSGFAEWLDYELYDIPDTLTPTDVAEITGYSGNSVDRWISRGWLKSVTAQSGKIIAREWLIEFYCGYGYTIVQMSDKHIRLMEKYFSEQ